MRTALRCDATRLDCLTFCLFDCVFSCVSGIRKATGAATTSHTHVTDSGSRRHSRGGEEGFWLGPRRRIQGGEGVYTWSCEYAFNPISGLDKSTIISYHHSTARCRRHVSTSEVVSGRIGCLFYSFILCLFIPSYLSVLDYSLSLIKCFIKKPYPTNLTPLPPSHHSRSLFIGLFQQRRYKPKGREEKGSEENRIPLNIAGSRY